MSLQTGGWASGATSTRSRLRSTASWRAESMGTMPSASSVVSSKRRTCGMRICSLILNSRNAMGGDLQNTKTWTAIRYPGLGRFWTFKADPEGGDRSARALFAAPRWRPTSEHITLAAESPSTPHSVQEQLAGPAAARYGRVHRSAHVPAGGRRPGGRGREGLVQAGAIGRRRGRAQLEHGLDEGHERRAARDGDAVKLCDGGADAQVGHVDRDHRERLGNAYRVEVGDVDRLEVDHARVLAQGAAQLAVAGIHSVDAAGAGLEQHRGEATGRRADVEGDAARYGHVEGRQGGVQLGRAAQGGRGANGDLRRGTQPRPDVGDGQPVDEHVPGSDHGRSVVAREELADDIDDG